MKYPSSVVSSGRPFRAQFPPLVHAAWPCLSRPASFSSSISRSRAAM